MPTPELISEKPPGVFYFDDGLYVGFCDADPNGTFDGDRGSVLVRRDTAVVYQKTTARGTLTGWSVVLTEDGLGFPLSDSNSIVRGNVTATKQLRFEVDTLVSAAQTRVMTIPDIDQILAGRNVNNSFSVSQDITKGSATLRLDGIIETRSDVVSTSGTGEDDLYTFNIPANTFQNPGDYVSVEASGFCNGAAGNKTVKAYFNTTTCAQLGAAALSGVFWNATMLAMLDADGVTIRCLGKIFAGTTMVGTVNGNAPTPTLTGAIPIKFTGECANGADSINQFQWAVRAGFAQ